MPSNNRITNKLVVTLAQIALLSLCFTISSCKESSNVSSNRGLIVSEASLSQPLNDDKVESTVDMKAQDGNLTNEQIQNTPPTVSRPRFPTPKPTPVPVPSTAQGSEGGLNNDR
jgi:hypothetical protein